MFKYILDELKDNFLFRTIKKIEKIDKEFIYFNDKKYLDLSSSNYLALRDDKRVLERVKKALDNYGLGSSASRLVVGNSKAFDELEEKISKLKKQDKTLIFNSGYDANLGTISSIIGSEDVVFCDKLNHASIYDGIFLSKAKLIRYKHNDMLDLEKKLIKYRDQYSKALIVTDTLFSMDGDFCDLISLVKLKKENNCLLMIDEAHSGGVYGEKGQGLAEQLNLLKEVDINMGTFSKAYGMQGGYVSSSSEIIDYLINKARAFIYSTALPPMVIEGISEAIDISIEEPWRKEKLQSLGNSLRAGLKNLGYDIGKSNSHIIPIIMKTNEEVIGYSDKLANEGLMVMPIRKPTVDSPRLRLSLNCELDGEKIINIFKKIKDEIDEVN